MNNINMNNNLLIIKTRDDREFKITLDTLLKMEDFFIKNMIEDTSDTRDLYIDEDYEIIKSIMDSLKYRELIFNNETNLKLMYYVCDKWCVPKWLLNNIENELYISKKILNLNTAIDTLTNKIYICNNCGVGFNKYDNKPNSCKFHSLSRIINSNKYHCCNKEEPCKVGYHCINTSSLSILIQAVNKIVT